MPIRSVRFVSASGSGASVVLISLTPNVELSGMPPTSLPEGAPPVHSGATPALAGPGLGTPNFKRRSANSYNGPTEEPKSRSLHQVPLERFNNYIDSYDLAISFIT